MARRSIESRCDRIIARLLPPGSFERRVYDLPDDLRDALQLHQTKVAVIISHVENIDPTPGAAYARLLHGDLTLPMMPQSLRVALGLVDPPEITEAMTLAEIGDVYQRFVEGTEQ